MRINDLNIGRLLKVASNQMVREVDAFASQFDLSGQQMLILDYLGKDSDRQVTQTMIEKEFNIRRSTTTEILQRMEKRNLVERKASLEDARQKFVLLTEHGQKYLPEITSFNQNHSKQMLSNLNDDEINAVEKFLHNFGG